MAPLRKACSRRDAPPQVPADAHDGKAIAAALQETSAADQTASVGLGSGVHVLSHAQGASEVHRLLHSGCGVPHAPCARLIVRTRAGRRYSKRQPRQSAITCGVKRMPASLGCLAGCDERLQGPGARRDAALRGCVRLDKAVRACAAGPRNVSCTPMSGGGPATVLCVRS